MRSIGKRTDAVYRNSLSCLPNTQQKRGKFIACNLSLKGTYMRKQNALLFCMLFRQDDFTDKAIAATCLDWLVILEQTAAYTDIV